MVLLIAVYSDCFLLYAGKHLGKHLISATIVYTKLDLHAAMRRVDHV